MKDVNAKRKEWLQSVDLVGEELNETDLNATLDDVVNSFIAECETNLYGVFLQTRFTYYVILFQNVPWSP